MRYYLTLNGQTVGPMTGEQLVSYPVNMQTPVSKDGSPWQPLYVYPELVELLRRSEDRSDSKRIVCGIMAILFGTLGIQYFLVGKIGGGLLTILISIITCGLWEIVTLIQGILMLTMTDAVFNEKYVYTDKTLPIF
ncbi:MAG: DUF4339 domain-containing protein [Muribaculaceae bacterium]|nr:DUF4339 domain-containing protein [Muribaculaceae bacterium]